MPPSSGSQAVSRDARDPAEALRLQGRVEWLGAFVTAFAMTSLLCFVFGAMIARYLG